MKRIVRASLVALAAACATTAPQWPEGRDASADRFKAHVETLASDAYEGREAGTDGYRKAVDYLTGQLAALGVEPAGTDGYLQPVPLRRALRDVDAMVLSYAGADGGAATLEPLADYLLDAPVGTDAAAVSARAAASGEIVFAGYGIDAPGLGVDSYEDLDVTGKIVLLLQGAPDGLPSEERAHFVRGSSKIEEAARRGAAGVLFLGTRGADEAGFAEGIARLAGAPSDTFAGRGAARGDVVSGYLFRDAARAMFARLGATDYDVAITPDADGRVAPFALGATASLETAATYENYASPNVVGVIEGSDPALRDEYVVLSAHLDHEGVGEAPEDDPDADVIYNGAMDNATGIATMLEAARRFAKAADRPKRSVLFLAVTAEEKGLLGSDYFARNPSVDGEIVANVNLDMPVLLYDFEDVIAFGAEHSSMEPLVREAARSMGVGLTPDPYPEMVLFVRSDHYSFVKQGVPSVFLFLGVENGGEDAFQTFMRTHYHRVSDQPDLPIRYDTGAKFAELNYRIARTLADAEQAPAWNDGDFFGGLYAR